MDKYAKLVEALKRTAPPNNVPLVTGKVKEITGESCTVIVNGDLELTEVRLKASINGDGNRIIVEPKPGSVVLLGSLTGDLKDLTVLKVDEMQKLVYQQDGLKIEVDSTDKKVSISNDSVSLIDVLQLIADIFKKLGLHTNNGATLGLLPDSLADVTQFEALFKSLLK